jgi:hypothetical protein
LRYFFGTLKAQSPQSPFGIVALAHGQSQAGTDSHFPQSQLLSLLHLSQLELELEDELEQDEDELELDEHEEELELEDEHFLHEDELEDDELEHFLHEDELELEDEHFLQDEEELELEDEEQEDDEESRDDGLFTHFLHPSDDEESEVPEQELVNRH